MTFLGSQSGSTITLLDVLGANVLLTTAVLLESLVGLAVLGEVGLRVGLRDGRGEWCFEGQPKDGVVIERKV